MRRLTLEKGEWYHFYNRGVDKRVVFLEPDEYKRFIAYLYLLNSEDALRPTDLIAAHSDEKLFAIDRGKPLVALAAYSLMPNHFHGLASPLVSNGLSKFMHRVQTAYTMFFNKRRKRVGALFQSAFKAHHVEGEREIKFTFSFIHLNPITLTDPDWQNFKTEDFLRFRKHVTEYPYSSMREHISGRHLITDLSKLPKYVTGKRDVDTYISMWLRAQERSE